MITTKLCSELGIDFPIINAPMTGTATAELASAVTRTGAFGMIGATLDPDPTWLKEQIQAVRYKTDLPFGVGFINSASGIEKTSKPHWRLRWPPWVVPSLTRPNSSPRPKQPE